MDKIQKKAIYITIRRGAFMGSLALGIGLATPKISGLKLFLVILGGLTISLYVSYLNIYHGNISAHKRNIDLYGEEYLLSLERKLSEKSLENLLYDDWFQNYRMK